MYKSGDESDLSSYRLILLPSLFNVIFEKIMYHRLKSYIERCNILHDSQYGFREKRSTEHAINFRIEFNMDRKLYSRGCSVTCTKPLTQ